MTGTQMMVVLIVAIVMFASVIKGRSGHGRRTPHLQPRADDAENARLRDEVAELKKRLAVLERITVEKENSLERQIEALRDR
jgi:uncharacterized protein YlxW (UPF0749 family)